MSFLKKSFFSLCMVFGMCIALSISAFALDVDYNSSDFTPALSPSYSGVSDDGVVYFNYTIPDNSLAYAIKLYDPASDDYLYLLFFSKIPLASGWSYDDFYWRSVIYVNSNNVSLATLVNQCSKGTVTSWTVFGASGSSSLFVNQAGSYNGISLGNPVFGNYACKFDEFSVCGNTFNIGNYVLCGFVPILTDTNVLVENNFSNISVGVRNIFIGRSGSYPSYNSGVWNTGSFTVEPFSYCVKSPTGYYSGIVSGNDNNLASSIIGSSIGRITDSLGNVYDITNEYNFEIPDKEFNNGVEYPDLSSVNDAINENITDLDIMDTSGSAFEFIYDRINDIAHGNNKILVMFTSCLSVGVIMMLLNKRSG